MKVSERIELNWISKYQKQSQKIKPIQEIAELCTSCPGACKASVGMKSCGRKTREKMKGDR